MANRSLSARTAAVARSIDNRMIYLISKAWRERRASEHTNGERKS